MWSVSACGRSCARKGPGWRYLLSCAVRPYCEWALLPILRTRTMLHRIVIGIGIIGGLAAVAPSAQEASSQPQQTFRSAVDLVTIQASVRDRHGRVVRGLTTTD